MLDAASGRPGPAGRIPASYCPRCTVSPHWPSWVGEILRCGVLLGTHQGSVEPAHLGSYLNEFVFRFNRRRSRSRGMVFYRVLELAAGSGAHEPVRYQDLIATKRPRAVSPTPPEARGHPPSLDRPPANRPWRTASPDGSG